MMVDETKFNLDAPTVPDSDQEEEQEAVEESSEATSEPVTPAEETVVEDEPARIPYSRFETVHERAVKAEAELEFLRSQRQETAEPVQFTGDLPEKWVKLYGDNEASREAYGLYKEGIKEEFKTMRGELVNEVRQEEYTREKEAEKTADEWATTISDFGAKNSRKFSDAEQSALLDVMDELAPKDDRGMYVVSPITYLEKAVELYDLRNQRQNFSKKEAKRKAASLAGASGEGEPNDTQSDGHFRPGQWDSWRNSPQLKG